MQADGDVSQIDPSGNVTTVYTATSGTKPGNGRDMNGLGIGKGGTTGFWYERTPDDINRLLSFSNGNVTAGTKSFDTGQNSSLVAGAVDLATGNFLFGQYVGSRFYLYAWTGSQFEKLGYVANAANSNWSGANGDIAFDAAGNLYLLASNGSNVIITEVNAADIAAAISNPSASTNIPGDQVSSGTVSSGTNFNGFAFDSDGYAYLGTGSGLYKYDPSTWKQIGNNPVTTKLGDSTDLASCGSPATLTVQKNLPNGRAAAGDQFTLAIATGGLTVTSVTTTGNDKGIQQNTAGPEPVVTGRTYAVSESPSGTTSFSNYAQSLACVDTANANAVVSSTGGKVTIPTQQPNSSAVVCTFTNIPIKATVNLSKTVQDTTGKSSPGQGWSLGAIIASGSTTNTTISPSGNQTTDGNGNTPQQTITFPSSAATANVAVSETQQAGYTFVSGSCTVTHIDSTTTTTPLTSAAQTLPGIKPGDSVSCGFTNKQTPGTATWRKVGADGSTLLGGSTWSLNGPNVPANTLVSDCTAAPCTTGAYTDQDPVAGQFQLTGLAWGDYTLAEKSPPIGYVGSATTYSFTVSATSLNPTVTGSPFKNTPVSPATVTISKQVADANGQNPKPASGWTMGAALSTPPDGVTISPTGTQKTAADGSTSPWTISGFATTTTTTGVTVSETQQNGYSFLSGSCTITHSDKSTTQITVNSASAQTLSGVMPGDAVACTYTNKTNPGAATWTKIDKANGELLSGSEWTLTGSGVPGNTVVSDCISTPCAAGAYADQDPAPGKFQLTNLTPGSYSLREKTVPVGYQLNPDTFTFTVIPGETVVATGPGVTNGAIPDLRTVVPVLPLTGGAAGDYFLLAGGGLIAAAGAGGWWQRRRSMRRQ